MCLEVGCDAVRCLKTLLCKNDIVTLEMFGQVVAWFGSVTTADEDGEMTFLDKIRTTLQVYSIQNQNTNDSDALLPW